VTVGALLWWLSVLVAFLVGSAYKARVWRRRLEAMLAGPDQCAGRRSDFDAGYRYACIELLGREGFVMFNDTSTGHP
jgi:hypothetical protein